MSAIKDEIANLKKRIVEDNRRLSEMSADFWARGGICCPGCGMPGYLDLELKQERRYKRLNGLKKKLEYSK